MSRRDADRGPAILVVNGPNLNLLGAREPALYGSVSLAEVNRSLLTRAQAHGIAVDFRQSNSEGVLIDAVQEAMTRFDAVIINAGGLSHTSIALRDALATIPVPIVEVHVTNIHAREEFRHHSFVSAVASAVIVGAGTNGYLLALAHLEHLLSATATSSRPSDAGLEQAAAPVSALVLDASPASSGIPASGPPEEAAADVRRRVSEVGARLGIRVEFFHGDDEQDLVAAIRGSARHDAIVIDAARLAVTSNAVREAVAALSIPVIELRESHPPADGRAAPPSLLSAVATTVITGAGDDAHSLALQQVAHLASARG